MEEIIHKNGNRKTVCVGACLHAIGIPQKTYKHTWNEKTKKNTWKSILNRNGFSYRSVRSKFQKGRISVQNVKNNASKVLDQTLFIIVVKGHILMINGDGRVKVDTFPCEGSDCRIVEAVYELSRVKKELK